MSQPMQPIVIDPSGVVRFHRNRVVRFLLDESTAGRTINLNLLSVMFQNGGFSPDDWEQFLQLIGYSVSGFGELGTVRPETVEAADKIAAEILEAKQ